MSTIKTIDVGGTKRVLLKTINGIKRVSCSCCGAGDFIFDIQTRYKSAFRYFCGAFNDGKYYKTVVEFYEDPWSEGNILTITYISTPDPVEDLCIGEKIYSVDITQDPYDDGSTFNYLLNTTYSDEDTRQNLKERVVSALGDFSEWENAITPPSSRGFRIEASSFVPSYGTITDSEMRVKHSRTSTGYLKMWFLKRSYDYDEPTELWTNPTDEDFVTYEWNGDPLNSELPLTDPANLIIGDPISIPYEDEIRNDIYPLKWSFVEGYEPSSPTDVEPFPTTTRPTPDCESNGFRTISEECPPPP